MREKEISFLIPGEPKGKQRPRTGVTRDGRRVMYTPAQTSNYENYIKLMYQLNCKDTKLSGPLHASITGVFAVPSSESRKRQAQMLSGEIRHTKKIDCDNLAKIVLDALNGLAYDDDKQVCELEVRKVYGETPLVSVSIWEVGPDAQEQDG